MIDFVNPKTADFLRLRPLPKKKAQLSQGEEADRRETTGWDSHIEKLRNIVIASFPLVIFGFYEEKALL